LGLALVTPPPHRTCGGAQRLVFNPVRQIHVGVLFLGLASACSDGNQTEPAPKWQLVHESLPGALLSVWGTGEHDVWAVGADARDGTGPLVVHYDGGEWERIETGQTAGTLWWVFGFEDGPVFMGGEGGVLLRYEGGEFDLQQTPGGDTVYGIWGATADDVWAVGGASESTGGFVWHYDGDTWEAEPSLDADVADGAAVWKVHGQSSDDAWFVGSNGVSLRWDGTRLEAGDTGVGSSLFTVHSNSDRYAAVGGMVSGFIVEFDEKWRDVTPDPAPAGLSGVALDDDEGGIAVGLYGAVFERSAQGWREVDVGFSLDENLHGVWLDDAGGVWAVGGQTLSEPLTDGLLIHRGDSISSEGL